MERLRKMKKKLLGGLRGRKKEEALQQPQEEEKGSPTLLPLPLPPIIIIITIIPPTPGLQGTLLHIACASGHINIVAFLVEGKCKLNVCDSDMRTPLMKAVECNQEKCAIRLLKSGADPNVTDAHGDTALHLAASTASHPLGQHLLDHGARLEAPNQNGTTPLMRAVVENNLDMVVFLLTADGRSLRPQIGGNVVPFCSFRTPLLLAISSGQRNAVNLLLAYESDVSHRDDSGRSAWDYATMSDNPSLLQNIAYYSKGKKEGESSVDTQRIPSTSDRPGRAGDPGATNTEGLLKLGAEEEEEEEEKEKDLDFPWDSEAGECRDPDEELVLDNAMLREEVATLRAELSRLQLRREEDKRRHLEDNGALEEKSIKLRKELKRSKEALAQAVSQRDGQVAALKTEAALLATQMDHLKGDKEKLENEANALRARLWAATRELEESRDSREGLDRALQLERDEAQRLKDRLEDEARALREANGGLSQRLGQAERRANALEGELQQATHALRYKTLLLEKTQRDLEEARGRAKELDSALQREKEQASQWAAKGEAIQERLAQLQSDNLLLRQRLEDLQSQGLLKERAVAGAQETIRDLSPTSGPRPRSRCSRRRSGTRSWPPVAPTCGSRLGGTTQKKANQEGVLRQLQQELADALKRQSSLEISVRCCNKLKEDKQHLQEEIKRIQSRLENERKKVKNLKDLKESAELRLEQEKKRNGELQEEYNRIRKLVGDIKKKLEEYENGETSLQDSFHGGLKNECSEIDKLEQLRKKLEVQSARRAQLELANAELQAKLSVWRLQKRCDDLQRSYDDLQKSKLQLQEGITGLRHQVQRHTFDLKQAGWYKRDAEDRVK
ncbi:hypothetical protein JRQ81_008995 [Phrynocephalus forsythii]|uniref:CCDC144C-like coiled-coil domain-containing protein n=1 Tax=Phrynocephalus forsythii TaxID=171643 RepID=A0A9Q0XD37_9SAUR|nr:hypothetical protein JRQ81_008995 [Phrynocephalus forsythii]